MQWTPKRQQYNARAAAIQAAAQRITDAHYAMVARLNGQSPDGLRASYHDFGTWWRMRYQIARRRYAQDLRLLP